MARNGRSKSELTLSGEECEQLSRWARRVKPSQALALRSRIVLECVEGLSNKDIAGQLRVTQMTVGKRRRRFVEARLDGLSDEPHPGRPLSIAADQVEAVVVATLEETPENATHWSRSKTAERSGLSSSTIGRIWKASDLKPHRADGSKQSNDPLFVEKIHDVVGLYLDPPEQVVARGREVAGAALSGDDWRASVTGPGRER
jgi:transposase